MSAFSRQRSACSTEALHCSISSQILHCLSLNKLAHLRITETPEGAFEHRERHHGLGHGAMASSAAIWPKSGTHEFAGTARLGGTPDRHNQVAAKNPRHHRPLHALHLETKLRKLRQHVLAFHNTQMGKEGGA